MKNIIKIGSKILITFTFFCLSISNAQIDSKFNIQLNSDQLDALNLISVTIGGDFFVNGTFTASRNETVDQFITRVIDEYKSQLIRTSGEKDIINFLKYKVNKFAQRNIKLKRYDGTEINVDLAKFRLTGDFSYNPYLQKNDVIIFPVLDLKKNFIDISGAVNKPTTFQYVEGDKLSDAILFAQGLNKAYKNIRFAKIKRLSDDGKKQLTIKVLISNNPALQRGDRIKIIAQENQIKNYKVLVLGEVKQPGYVYITKDSTDLREVIFSAGGFTKDASLERSTILRGTTNENLLKMQAIKKMYENNEQFDLNDFQRKFEFEKLDNYSFLRMNDEVIEDSLYFLIDLKLRQFLNNGIVDFTEIFSTKDSSSAHFYLKDGDIILVPEKLNTVYVFGQVNSPGYVPFEKNRNCFYYIEKAGGLGEDYRNDFKIIRSTTKSWVSADDSTYVYPGDFVYVPKSPTRSFIYYLKTASFITSIASALATVAILILNLARK